MNMKGLTSAGARAWTAASVCTLWLSLAASAQAQMVYRIVGADGKVTFSDKPPVSADQGKVATAGAGAVGTSAASFPYELRQVVSRYPVTLYSAPECTPCASGRALLSARGVPFSERTVTTSEDIAALKRISGEISLPFLTIGGQRIKGFSDQEWTQYLEAAGYPKTSLLPAGYRQAPASPLVAVEKPGSGRAETAPETPLASPAAGPTPSNPAGIQF